MCIKTLFFLVTNKHAKINKTVISHKLYAIILIGISLMEIKGLLEYLEFPC